MNVKVKKGWRMLLVLVPLALIIGMFFAISGPSQAVAHNSYYVSNDTPADGTVSNDCWGTDPVTGQYRRNLVSPFGTYDPDTGEPAQGGGEGGSAHDPNAKAHDYWDSPNKCHAAPWGMNDNLVADALGLKAGDTPIDDILDAEQVQEMLTDGDPANPGKPVHIIDVREPAEQFDGVNASLVSILAAPYPMSNSGHPIWKDDASNWVESFNVPLFVGFYWAGTTISESGGWWQGNWQFNYRPVINPNYLNTGYQDNDPTSPNVTMNNYFDTLMAQGEIADGDTFVFLSQRGWRASYASAIFRNMPGFQNSRVYNLYGGMRAWTGTPNPESVFSADGFGPEDGGYVTDKDAYNGDGECRPLAGLDNEFNTTDGIDNDGDGRTDETNPILGDPGPCDHSKRLRTLPGQASNSTGGYNHARAASSDPEVKDRYAYNTTRLAKAGAVPIWDGHTSYVGVKPWWFTAYGAGDFKLTPAGNNSRWVDYANRKLAVDYVVRNDPAYYMTIDSQGRRNTPRQNYYDECGGAPVEEGGQCDTVLTAPWGPAYNVEAKVVRTGAVDPVTGADNGVTVDSVSNPCLPDNPLGGYCTPITPGGRGVVTVIYDVGGLQPDQTFTTNPVVTATDIPDAKRSIFGAFFEWYFTYTYSHWTQQVTVPSAPVMGAGGM